MELIGRIVEIQSPIEVVDEGVTSKRQGVLISNPHGKGAICVYLINDLIDNFSFPIGTRVSFKVNIVPFEFGGMCSCMHFVRSFFEVKDNDLMSLLSYKMHGQIKEAIVHNLSLFLKADSTISDKIVKAEITIDNERHVINAFKSGINERLFLLNDFKATISFKPQKNGRIIADGIYVDVDKLTLRQYLLYLGRDELDALLSKIGSGNRQDS